MKITFSISFVILFFTNNCKSVTEDVGSECESDSECLPSKDCQYYKDQQETLKSTTDKTIKTNIIKDLRGRICNKKERALCCPNFKVISESAKRISAEFESEFESCGLSQVVASNVSFKYSIVKPF